MRALLLLLALVVSGTLHATELDAGDVREGRCESRQGDDARHPGESAATPEPATAVGSPRGSSEAIGDRNRMSPRWHSLLPGMFR